MGRSPKVGLDYFRLDVKLDEKFELIEAEFGLKGFAVVVKLYQRIYGGNGYYCEWNSDIGMVFSRSINEGANLVSEIVNASIRRELFDSSLYEKYQILTSKGIQQRYLEAAEHRQQVSFKRDYLLIPIDELPKKTKINWIYSGINPINSEINPQRRGEQSRGEERKGKDNYNSGSPNPFAEDTVNGGRPDYDSLVVYASNNLQYLSPDNMDELVSFRDSMTDDMIRHAIDIACGKGKRTYYYVRGILNNFIENGYKTIGDVKAAEAKRKKGERNGNGNAGGGSERDTQRNAQLGTVL